VPAISILKLSDVTSCWKDIIQHNYHFIGHLIIHEINIKIVKIRAVSLDTPTCKAGAFLMHRSDYSWMPIMLLLMVGHLDVCALRITLTIN